MHHPDLDQLGRERRERDAALARTPRHDNDLTRELDEIARELHRLDRSESAGRVAQAAERIRILSEWLIAAGRNLPPTW